MVYNASGLGVTPEQELRLVKCFEPRRTEMGVIGECLGNPKSAHNGEGYVVNDAGLRRLASLIRGPGKVDVGLRGFNEAAASPQPLPQINNILLEREA